MREGKRVVSLQAANKEVMYYYTPISRNHPLLWLFHAGLVWSVTLCLVLFTVSVCIWRKKWNISLSTLPTTILNFRVCAGRQRACTYIIWILRCEFLHYIVLWTHLTVRVVFSQLPWTCSFLWRRRSENTSLINSVSSHTYSSQSGQLVIYTISHRRIQ